MDLIPYVIPYVFATSHKVKKKWADGRTDGRTTNGRTDERRTDGRTDALPTDGQTKKNSTKKKRKQNVVEILVDGRSSCHIKTLCQTKIEHDMII